MAIHMGRRSTHLVMRWAEIRSWNLAPWTRPLRVCQAGPWRLSLRARIWKGAGKGNSIKTEVAELIRQFVGDGDNDTFTGINDGLRETFSGGGGNDTFDGKAGGDVFFGSAGTDTASYASAPTGVVANLGNSSLNTGDAAGDAYSSIENLRGSAFADRLTGDGVHNVVDGAGGDDIVDGGGAGDAMRGGAGNDTYVVDNPSDVVDESIAGSTGADTVRSLMSFSLADGAHAKGNIENLTLAGNSDFNITGNLLANGLTGNAGANILDGGLNDDTLNGGLGNDVLIGSADATVSSSTPRSAPATSTRSWASRYPMTPSTSTTPSSPS